MKAAPAAGWPDRWSGDGDKMIKKDVPPDHETTLIRDAAL